MASQPDEEVDARLNGSLALLDPLPGTAQHSPRIICKSSGMLHGALLSKVVSSRHVMTHDQAMTSFLAGLRALELQARLSPGNVVGLFNMPILALKSGVTRRKQITGT